MKRMLVVLLLVLFVQQVLAEDLFPTPKKLVSAVAFWTKVYSQIEDDRGYIHDNRRLNDVYATFKPDAGSRRVQQKQIKAALADWRTALRNYAKGLPVSAQKTKKIRAIWGEKPNAKRLFAAADRLRFQRGQANRFRAGLIRSGAFKPFIRAWFKRRGLPLELAYLPHVESSFDATANSHAGAAGLWQFTRPTGRRFMRIDAVIDERLDPFKATIAAAELLAHNYQSIKSWPLALTAYNHGLGGMHRAAKVTGSKDMGVIAERYKGRLFGFASRNFYASFLAARQVAKNAQNYFGELELDSHAAPRTITLDKFVTARHVARALAVNLAELKAANPAVQSAVWRGEKYLPQGYDLVIPEKAEFAEAEEQLKKLIRVAGVNAQRNQRIYRVRKGDQLASIARRFKVRTRDLAAANQIKNKNSIRIGQKLRIPTRGPIAVKPSLASQLIASVDWSLINPKSKHKTYQVRRGDTLSRIAHRQKVPLAEVLALNHLSLKSNIYPGQKLTLPLRAGATVVARKNTQLENDQIVVNRSKANESRRDRGEDVALLKIDLTHYLVSADNRIEVQPGETLGHYAKWLDLRVGELRKLNRFPYGRNLHIGQLLKMDFSRIDRVEFQNKRSEFHRQQRAAFLAQNAIVAVCETEVDQGDTLWMLASGKFDVPIWLLRQYNPELGFSESLPPGSKIRVPVVVSSNQAGESAVENIGDCETLVAEFSRIKQS